MAIDLDSMSYEELEVLERDVQKAKTSLAGRRRAEALAAAREAAKQHGFSLDEILKKERAGGKTLPKFRNPENPEQTWTGRGRKPDWLKQKLEDGANMEDFAI